MSGSTRKRGESVEECQARADKNADRAHQLAETQPEQLARIARSIRLIYPNERIYFDERGYIEGLEDISSGLFTPVRRSDPNLDNRIEGWRYSEKQACVGF